MLSTLESEISRFRAWANAKVGIGFSTRMSPRQTGSGEAPRMTLKLNSISGG